ncbi:MAG: PocR ligand-binding domain-containing protein [Clostridia bacterium]
MKPFNKRDDVGFDLDRAIGCVETYSHTVGVGCFIIDTYGDTLYHTEKNKNFCDLCQKMQKKASEQNTCENVHLYGSYQAERFGGKYIFFCPMGLVHWASPVSVDGMMRGAILGGPALMVDPEEFLIEEIFKKNNIDLASVEEFDQYISEIPIIQPEKVNSASETLFIFAAYISDIQPSLYLHDRENLEQQSDISEYIHYIKTMGGDDSKIQGYPLEKERELLSLISMGDKTGSQKVLNEIFGHIFFSTGGNFDIIKARVLELIVLLSRAALEGGADVEQIFGLNYRYLTEIHGFRTVEDLTYWLSKIMIRFTDCVFNLKDVKHVDVIYKAVDYVKRNYMRKITLEEVAAHVYLSSSYFSKIFKDEMECNFSTYLNQVRIEISKKLLLDDVIPLVDISNLAGFEDQSYFSKVFKKITKVSPGKYRESRGQYR